jgi:TPR repeat protein
MPDRLNLGRLALVILLALASHAAEAQSTNYAEHTPGNRALSEGTRYYENGWYFTARHRFRKAARYADKMAQHNLGVIYYRGDGVERDPARAWAWFELAAERDYPEFVGIANAVWDELPPTQRQRGRAFLDELLPEYADEVAVPRAARRMERDRQYMTGSRVGFVRNLEIYDINSAVPRTGEDYYAADKWNLQAVIQQEKDIFEALARARVTIGDLEFVEDGDETRADEAQDR